ncbi:VOC family protein [Nocardia stercoris]|uniref:VOC family protein n=1 Tax=Nocardia stercoris TaxID=2483361 RepID=A0A3M2KX82_9NOCA|nr:VOC family protein [Nocardia stercoris]RMI28115.1 VOC family protein [Nocardia stercoris]
MPVRSTPWPQGTPCWVDCQADDAVKEAQFYADLFGWTVDQQGPEAGGYIMAMRNGRSAAGIGPKPMAGTPSAWTTYFAVDSADETAKKVTEAGGQVVVAPMDVMSVGRMFVAMDTVGAIFAGWEARDHSGAQIFNEHGSYSWNELHTRELDRAEEFYAQVFGFDYTEVGDGKTMRYAMFTPPGADEAVGGMNDDTKMPGEPGPSYWLTWFQYDNVDEGVARAMELRSEVMMPATDSPVGRMAILAAPQGEMFGIIDTNVRVGDMPQ